jgi:hypothetical protein
MQPTGFDLDGAAQGAAAFNALACLIAGCDAAGIVGGPGGPRSTLQTVGDSITVLGVVLPAVGEFGAVSGVLGEVATEFESVEGALQGATFRSFSQFKRAVGPAGVDLDWHHIAEQTGGNLTRFGRGAIQNSGNLLTLDRTVHKQISAFYSSIQPQITGSTTLTVRRWLSSQSLAAQQAFGLEVIRMFGGR